MTRVNSRIWKLDIESLRLPVIVRRLVIAILSWSKKKFGTIQFRMFCQQQTTMSSAATTMTAEAAVVT